MQYEYEYQCEEIKKCYYCNHYIEYKYCKVIVNKTKLYYHKDCIKILHERLKRF